MKNISWLERLVYLLQIFILVMGVYELFSGKLINGISSLLLSGVTIFHAQLTRNTIKYIPTEFKFIFLSIIILQIFVGEILDFYRTVPYFDKFLHILFCFLTGSILFLIAYSLNLAGKLKINVFSIIFVVILMTLGVGALWEIMEYFSDTFIHPIYPNIGMSQVSIVQSPLVDTMTDLITDLIGGFLAAFITTLYIKLASRSKNPRFFKLTDIISKNFNKT